MSVTGILIVKDHYDRLPNTIQPCKSRQIIASDAWRIKEQGDTNFALIFKFPTCGFACWRMVTNVNGIIDQYVAIKVPTTISAEVLHLNM